MHSIKAAAVVSAAASFFVIGCTAPPEPPTETPPQLEAEPVAAVTDHAGSPLLADLADGWNTIRPGGDTMCLYGTDYGYFVRPKDPDNILISFPGGGACWSGLTCTDEPVGRMDDNPKTVRAEDNPAGSQGIMSDDNPENPFVDYTKILVGYCTGDMHIGDATMANDGPLEEGQVRVSDTLHFNGYTNAMTVLDWVFDNFESPESVVVSGHTSGSYGTPFYASYVADRYPDAAVRHIGDGNGALYLGELLQPIRDAWGTVDLLNGHEGFEGLDPGSFSFEDITIRAARRHPEIVFTQIVTAYDSVFSEMIDYLGYEEPILTAIDAGQAYVKSQV
ncbi:MAG TPA: pectin acetylesterase-family hydrolase, partial [Gammaproteobacteria bacterium]